MGSYHSYVGDMKLEDSKDNWYRISGLNTTGADMFGFKYSEKAAGGQYEIRNSTTQVTLFKLVQSFTNIYSTDPVTENIDSRGAGFVIKDKQLEFQNIFPDDSKDKKLYGKGYYISNHTPLYIGIYGIRTLASPRGIRLETVQPDESTYFRPTLTLKPKGGEVLERFTLKIKITRKFTTPNGPHMYRVSFIPEIIEGNPSIIKEAIYKFGIGRNGEDLPDGTYSLSKAEAKTRERPLEAGEVVAYESAHGVIHAAGGVGALYKLINGKYLYIKQLNSLPGMEQPWPNNGGITTSIVTFTEADAYTI
jgi:hypothetical protein